MRTVELTKTYRQGCWFARTSKSIPALRGINIAIRQGATLGVIGPSGAGKTTLARCLASFEAADSGEIWFDEMNISRSDRGTVCLRRQIQMVFQDATGSLSPRLSALEIVSEPLLIAGEEKQTRHQRARELMQLVGLPANSASRLAYDFSSGQRRRLAIARALALQPRVLILDEALAGLDLSIRAQISNLLLEIQAAFSLTCICVSHDLDLVAHIADDIAIMEQGRIIDTVPAASFSGNALQLPNSRRQTSLPCSKARVGV